MRQKNLPNPVVVHGSASDIKNQEDYQRITKTRLNANGSGLTGHASIIISSDSEMVAERMLPQSMLDSLKSVQN